MAKKSVNVDLNMTPFIGLFALLVVMLLLTAVWNRIFVLSTDTSATSSSDTPPPNPEKKAELSITIMPKRLEMNEDKNTTNIPHLATGEIDRMRLAQMLAYWKQKHPKRTDVILNTDNRTTYQMMISVFDTMVGNEWPDVGVNTQ